MTLQSEDIAHTIARVVPTCRALAVEPIEALRDH
jgi:hypothetical protein